MSTKKKKKKLTMKYRKRQKPKKKTLKKENDKPCALHMGFLLVHFFHLPFSLQISP